MKAYEEGYAVALIRDCATIELTAVFAWYTICHSALESNTLHVDLLLHIFTFPLIFMCLSKNRMKNNLNPLTSTSLYIYVTFYCIMSLSLTICSSHCHDIVIPYSQCAE